MVRRCAALFLLLLCEGGYYHAHAQNYWIPLTRPTVEDLLKVSFVDSLTGWAAGTRGTILKTKDGGLSWSLQKTLVGTDIVNICMINQRTGWALSPQYFPVGNTPAGTLLLKTTNGGSFWEQRMYPVSGKYFLAIAFLDSLHGWIGGDAGAIAGTSDGGTTWFEANVDTSIFARFTILTVKFLSPKVGFAAGGRFDLAGVVWRTTDYGQHWTSTAVSSEPLRGLQIFDSLSVLCAGGDLEYGSITVHTTDGGDQWEYRPLGIFGEARGLSFRTRGEGWAPLGFASACMVTTDSAKTWREWLTPEITPVYDVLFTDPRHGYMVGARGVVLKYNAALLDVSQPPREETPSTFWLYQNYPNPFNSATMISYSVPPMAGRDLVSTDGRDGRLPVASDVKLVVYDLLSREVATLVNEVKQPGMYMVRWEAGGMASGVYFCRFQASQVDGGQAEPTVQWRRMLLLR